jgi:hypothetical protein
MIKKIIILFLLMAIPFGNLSSQPVVYPDIVPFSNYTATTSPTVNDDEGDGYDIGSVWFDISSDTGYVCLDATSGAAIWKITTDTYSSSSPLTTKGDILTYSATDVRLGVGSNDQLLTADSAEATGIKWAWDVLDQDTFSSNSNSSLATQQSIKSYVDASSYPPGGSDTHIQYNDSGVFSGNSGLVYNDSTYALTGGGNWEISKDTPEIKLTDTGDSNNVRLVRTDISGQVNLYATVLTQGGGGNALDFDGTDDDVSTTSVIDLDTVTFAAWVKTTQAIGKYFIPVISNSLADYSQPPHGALAIANSTGKARMYAGFISGSYRFVDSTTSVNDGSWHLIVGTSDVTNGIRIFVDGNLENSNPSYWVGQSVVTPDLTTIGKHTHSTGSESSFYDGIVDGVAIWSESISANVGLLMVVAWELIWSCCTILMSLP